MHFGSGALPSIEFCGAPRHFHELFGSEILLQQRPVQRQRPAGQINGKIRAKELLPQRLSVCPSVRGSSECEFWRQLHPFCLFQLCSSRTPQQIPVMYPKNPPFNRKVMLTQILITKDAQLPSDPQTALCISPPSDHKRARLCCGGTEKRRFQRILWRILVPSKM